jgi:tRNA pseudouridine55 synthase
MRFDVGPGSMPGSFRIDVECSSGTYVRSLVADLGTALGGGAHLRGLRRTAIGSFTVAGARRLDALSAADVVAPAEALRDYGRIAVDAAIARLVSHGRPLDRAEVGDPPEPGPWAVVDPEGELLAVYEADGTGRRLRPAVVFGPAG